jgi:plasmid stabilization system protein ParE
MVFIQKSTATWMIYTTTFRGSIQRLQTAFSMSFLVAFDLLARFPHQGHFRSDLTSKPLRFKVIRNYLIAYAYEMKPLWIVAVIDGRRNPRVIASILRDRE